MSNFVYPPGTPLGVVPSNYVLPDTEWALTIQQLFKAPNFTDGSTHAPSAFVTVGGSGFELTGTGHSLAASARLNVESTAEVRLKNGALLKADGSLGDIRLEVISNVATLTAQNATTVNLNGTVDVKGALTFKDTGGPGSAAWESNTSATFANGAVLVLQNGSTTTLGGQVNVSSTGVLTFQNNSTITSGSTAFAQWSGTWWFAAGVTFLNGSTLTGNSTATGTWNGAWTFGSTLTVTGAASLSSTLAVAGVTTFSARTERSGTDAYDSLRFGNGPDASTTIDAHEKDVWTSAATANRTWTINNGPAGKAFIARFVAPASNTLSLSSSGFNVDLSRIALSGDYKAITALWTGSEWINLGGPTV